MKTILKKFRRKDWIFL